MKLPIPFLKSKKEESEYYLSLILTDEKAGALILKAVDGTLKKINANESFFPESLDDITLDDLTTTIDKAISRAEEVLPPDIQTHQTIFGVKDSWVDSETKKIKKEYLEKLKRVCNSLDLTPIGFMVTTEAITHLMQEEEGAPVSAVFVEVGKKYVNLSLLRGGKIIESIGSPHLESVPLTVDKLLGHFTVPVLPARIVIFQSKPSERTSHAFLSHQWSKHLPFLHMPQVTVLPQEFDMRSVMAGAAVQMGFTILESKADMLPKLPTKVLKDEMEEAGSLEEPMEGDNFKEVPTDSHQSDGETTAEQEVADAEAASDFGFVINQDIADHRPSTHAEEQAEDLPRRSYHEEEPIDGKESENMSSRRKMESGGSSLLSTLSAKFPKNFRLPTVGGLSGIFKGKQTALKIIIPLVIIVILVIGTIYFYYNKMQANIQLTMTPNSESQDETVTFSTGESSDFNHNLIAAKSISTSISGQASVNATGSKDVGDKAKGTVTIYNNNQNSVTLNSGTTLTASNGQVFLLDNNVTVASSSGDIFSGTTPGTTQTTVTAKDLGTDGNLPSGTEFQIGSDNTVAAKNDNAFSGGTKKTVTVVSANDIANLRSQLSKSVQGSAQQKLSAQADSGYTVLPLAGSPTLSNEVFNHHVGDQATQVTLNGSVNYTGMEYQNSDLDSFAKTIMKNKFPQDPNIANNSVKETVNDANQRTSQAITATVSIQAGLLPNVNNQDVISLVQKKSLGDAKNALGNIPQVQSADITFSPPIPLLPLLFPSLPHHINVTVKSQ
jgi:baseplate J-like protein